VCGSEQPNGFLAGILFAAAAHYNL